MQVAPDLDRLGGEPAVGEGDDARAARLQHAADLRQHRRRVEQIFDGSGADHEVEMCLRPGQFGAGVEVLHNAFGQARIGVELGLVHAQAGDLQFFSRCRQMRDPTAHQVENALAGLQKAAVKRADFGAADGVEMMRQARASVEHRIDGGVLAGQAVRDQVSVAGGYDRRLHSGSVEQFGHAHAARGFARLFTKLQFRAGGGKRVIRIKLEHAVGGGEQTRRAHVARIARQAGKRHVRIETAGYRDNAGQCRQTKPVGGQFDAGLPRRLQPGRRVDLDRHGIRAASARLCRRRGPAAIGKQRAIGYQQAVAVACLRALPDQAGFDRHRRGGQFSSRRYST